MMFSAVIKVLTITAVLFSPRAAMAQELKPLDVVIDSFKSSGGDLAHVEYLLQRCSGLYLALSWLRRPANEAEAEKLLEHVDSLLKMTIETHTRIAMQRSGGDPAAVEKSLRNRDFAGAGIATANLYMERMKKNYLLTGNYFADDPGMQREMRICESPMEAIRISLEPPRRRP